MTERIFPPQTHQTRDQYDPMRVDRTAILAAFCLPLFAVIAVFFAQATGIGLHKTPESPVIQSVEFRFERSAEGQSTFIDPKTGAVLAAFAPGTGGFLTGYMNGVTVDRTRVRQDIRKPFLLTIKEDGRLHLIDLGNGRRHYLNGFGNTNANKFLALFPEQKTGG